MNIVILCPGIPFHGGTLAQGKSLGGSESAAYYTARELARHGHQVTLFTQITPEEEGVWDGVRYLSAGTPTGQSPLGERFEWYASHTPHDLLVIQRAPMAFHRPYASKVNFWWTHDLALKRHLPSVAGQMWNVDRVLAVSAFHQQQIVQVYGFSPEVVEVIPNGIDHGLYLPPQQAGTPEEEFSRRLAGGRMMYSSRPERGLEYLVGPGGVMERLARSAPELKLVVAGYENTTPAMAGLYQALWERCRRLPNVELAGALSKQDLARQMENAWLHLYPTAFEEVSCITAMETQGAGTPILTTPVAALPETLRDGGVVWLDPAPDTLAARLAEEILRLKQAPETWAGLHRRCRQAAPRYDWARSASGMVSLAERILAERCASPSRLARHLLRHSDIFPLTALAESPLGQEGLTGPIGQNVVQDLATHYGFVKNNNYPTHNEALTRHHLQGGEDPGIVHPEGLWAMPRFQVAAEPVAALPENARVLDYGCGQGHFTLALARRFPRLRFTGIDISAAAVAVGRAHAEKEGLTHLFFSHGEAANLGGTFDLVLALEVMEHTPRPWELADQLERRLAPGGTLCLTVPYGPWEAAIFETCPLRAHIHHLERADLETMWGHKPGFSLLAVPHGFTPLGEPLGVYQMTWQAGGRPSQALNPTEKLTRQAPPETVSVCMVAAGHGRTLARALESVKPMAAQLVLGLDDQGDPNAPAWEIARRYGAQAFSLRSPLETGFDEARNQTLARAEGDWILWLDDDEVLEWPERLWKYLRPNAFAGYAVKQHHYAVEPAGILKTDYPCRLFRRVPGVKFFGVVHEHPERELNQGLGAVMLLPDVAICHNGYETEAVRRQRFARNLPLMIRDREKYPQRLLGRFLWIRDLAHLIRYDQESQTDGAMAVVTPAMEARARQIVAMWRALTAEGHTRLALDSLPYYSEAAALLAQGGIAFEAELGAFKDGLGDRPGQPLPRVSGRFAESEDIHRLMGLLLKEKTEVFQERYF
ncbi:MAG: methyltransferase domain-containing protein [Deltaproteobacteria bacterium]|nr:methyltransferase domain-containing protein [Deltaproteobacteria bacterium]